LAVENQFITKDSGNRFEKKGLNAK